MAGIYSQGGSAGHRYAGWLSEVEAKNFQFGGKVFNGSPSAIYVGSNWVWIGWLSKATKQAIMDAFLDDGMAVIQATIAYLNQLAASGQAGKDKATALAALINEDPMMVCSLGLQPEGVTMPRRYVQTTGAQHTSIGLDVSIPVSYFDCKCEFLAANAAPFGMWANTSASGAVSFDSYSGGRLALGGNLRGINAGLTQNTFYDLKYQDGALYVNGNFITNKSSNTSSLTQLGVFCLIIGGNPNYFKNAMRLDKLHMIAANEIDLVPFKKKDGDNVINCLLDLSKVGVEGATLFYYNQGTGYFTIEYTLPDGTPWTPSTP